MYLLVDVVSVWCFLMYNSREAELEEDDELFIGPAPPAMVAEAESANEAERFEEVPDFAFFESQSYIVCLFSFFIMKVHSSKYVQTIYS